MEKNEFDNLMNDYIKSSSDKKESDLQKLKLQSALPRKKSKSKIVIAVVAAVLIVSVCLAIALPLSLKKDDSDKGDDVFVPTDYYLEENDVDKVVVTDVSDLSGQTIRFTMLCQFHGIIFFAGNRISD